jgi:hypothetical protein
VGRKVAGGSLVAVLTLLISFGAWWFPRTPPGGSQAGPAPTAPSAPGNSAVTPAPPNPTGSGNGRVEGAGNNGGKVVTGAVQPVPGPGPTGQTTTAAPRPPTVSPPPGPNEKTPARLEPYTWSEANAIDLNSDAADWGAKPGDWSDNDQIVRDIGWTYQGGIGVDGGHAGTVTWNSPIARSSCDQAWANQTQGLPTMQASLKFCAFIGGAVAMIAVHQVTKADGPATADVEIAVWK